ncbi:MAG: SDR family NAD(P)-dependent oxidoreductase, partial [Marinilabiliales bacterium]|nr:SDR family NAD(P)-dependent oxidoreductase [Marinilabiliales bacterium]
MNKKVLVTGGTGYIGSHTAVELQNAGFEVVIIDDLSNSTAGVVDQITAITGIKPDFHCFNMQDEALMEAFF